MKQTDDQLRLLAVANYRLFLATLVGHPAPSVSRLNATLTHPKPGDLVMEISTIYFPKHDQDRFGRLIVVRDEITAYLDEATAELNNHEVIRDRITYIETFNGELARWYNCDFIRVLEDLRNEEGDERDAQRSLWVADAIERHGLHEQMTPQHSEG